MGWPRRKAQDSRRRLNLSLLQIKPVRQFYHQRPGLRRKILIWLVEGVEIVVSINYKQIRYRLEAPLEPRVDVHVLILTVVLHKRGEEYRFGECQSELQV